MGESVKPCDPARMSSLFLPGAALQCSTVGASLWHPRNGLHPQSSLLHQHPPAPAEPPHPLDAESMKKGVSLDSENPVFFF